MNHIRFITPVLAAAISSIGIYAGVRPVPVSLKSTVSQNIGKTTVAITYSRPNAKGREIFGGLVPYGEVWRTGANQATTIESDTDVTLAGNAVPKGRYAFFTVPGEESWTVILNNTPDQFGAFTYDAASDRLRFEVPSGQTAAPVETFEIAFARVAGNAAEIELRWDETAVAIPVSVTDASNLAQIQAEIDRDIIGGAEPTWGNYGEAARFYVKQNKDPEQALEWFGKCTDLNPEAFWMFYERARFLASLGRKDDAIAAAEAGIAAAKAVNNQGGQDMGRAVMDELGKS